MSRDWTPKELHAASEAMKAAGHMSYEEFCAELDRLRKNIRIHFTDGNYITTWINADEATIRELYPVGKALNIGTVDDYFAVIERVEILDGDGNAPAGPGNELQRPSSPGDR